MSVDGSSAVRSRRRAVAVCLVLYAVALLIMIGARPLWLDEVIQLSVTKNTNWHDMLQHVKQNPGGAPLGYATQHWLISIVGGGVLSARLLSLLAGLGTLGVLLRLAKELELRGSVFAACLWMVCPLALRYSLEGRPYMQAMLFASLAVLAQIKLRKTSNLMWAVVLAACLCAAVYSQPYAVLGPLGFSLCSAWQRRDFKYVALTYGAYAIAALSFLPWWFAAHLPWADTVVREGSRFELIPSLRVLLRECFGDGYAAAIPVLLLVLYGAREFAWRPLRDQRMQLLAGVISGAGCALVGDALSNYFFAMRQVIYILPFLLLLVADAAASLWNRRRTMALIAVAALAGASLAKDCRYFADHREDWQRLSDVLVGAAEHGCVLLPGGDSSALYEVFRPDIRQYLCTSGSAARVIMPVHAYTDPGAVRLQTQRLLDRGLRQVSTKRIGFATVAVFEKR